MSGTATGSQEPKGAAPPEDTTIFTYRAPWELYAMGFCNRTDPKHRFTYACGSFIEEYRNKVHIV
jgi:hypothetical protein